MRRTALPLPRLAVALDAPSLEPLESTLDALHGLPVLIKVGLSLFAAVGPSVVHHMELAGFRVFLDLKLHDIPHQVGLAVAAVARLHAEIVTVHAAGGAAMLQAAVAAAQKRTRVVGVTLLTSLDEGDLRADGIGDGPGAAVARRLDLCVRARLDGVVLSGHELHHARGLPAGMIKVVPGVRPTATELGNGAAAHADDDQRRTVSVHEAVAGGADLIVVGRPILQAADPRKAAESVLAAIEQARQEN